MTIRCRFAPSPTGNLHIGTLRAALFNWLIVKSKNGKLICRIEDTDQQRSKKEYEKSIFDSLNWLGLSMDESPETGGKYGPYRQSERQKNYQDLAAQLLAQDKAYHCFATPAELDQEKQEAKKDGRPYIYSGKYANLDPKEAKKRIGAGEQAVLRFRMPKEVYEINDLIRGSVKIDGALLGDFVIMKSDGNPSYNFAVVVDDIQMAITHVIRGEDHISNTPKQIAIFNALNQPIPKFAHLPMILGPDKSKLSKRHGATNVIDYKAQGFLPEALLNYLALLGWTPKDNQEILSIPELIDQFDIQNINKSNAIFDIQKLKWMNSQYIKKMPTEHLKTEIEPFLSEPFHNAFESYTSNQQLSMLDCIKDNIDQLSQINDHLALFLAPPEEKETKIKEIDFNKDQKEVLTQILEQFSNCTHWTTSQIESCVNHYLESSGLGKGKVLKPIRLATTANPSGPYLMTVLELIGKHLVCERLKIVIQS